MKWRRWLPVSPDDGCDDVADRRTLIALSHSSAHVVGRAARYRRDQHSSERFPDLIRVGIVEKGDPLTANLITAWNHRLGENMDEARYVGFIGQPVLEPEAGGTERSSHALCVDDVARGRVADPQTAARSARVPD